MRERTYIIKDKNGLWVYRVKAASEKEALEKCVDVLESYYGIHNSGLYNIRRVKSGKWVLFGTLGGSWTAEY